MFISFTLFTTLVTLASAYRFPNNGRRYPAANHQPARRADSTVRVRIEGSSGTLFEGSIYPQGTNITLPSGDISGSGHAVTTPSGGTHKCDGTNNGQNPTPGPTCTSVLDDAARTQGFTFDGTYDSNFDDFFITRIGPFAQTNTQFWGLLLNYQFTPVGGCQQQVAQNDEILWAFDAFSKSHFLKIQVVGGRPDNIVSKTDGVVLQVTDGSSGQAVGGATVVVDGVTFTSDTQGKIQVEFAAYGVKSIKAEKSDSIRSNAIVLTVA